MDAHRDLSGPIMLAITVRRAITNIGTETAVSLVEMGKFGTKILLPVTVLPELFGRDSPAGSVRSGRAAGV